MTRFLFALFSKLEYELFKKLNDICLVSLNPPFLVQPCSFQNLKIFSIYYLAATAVETLELSLHNHLSSKSKRSDSDSRNLSPVAHSHYLWHY